MQSKYDRISLLLNELDNEQNISMFMQSLDKITQEVIDICREFYKNNEYLTILQFYNLITSQYEKMISIKKKILPRKRTLILKYKNHIIHGKKMKAELNKI
jgi:hypothetical protein